jgi:hypothetical protein
VREGGEREDADDMREKMAVSTACLFFKRERVSCVVCMFKKKVWSGSLEDKIVCARARD